MKSNEDSSHLVRVTFGWGLRTRSKELTERYSNLPEKERRRLTRVALRAQAALMLRYQVVVRYDKTLQEQEWQFALQDLPVLETYLLFTCLEALAASAYRPFPEWLEDNSDNETWAIGEVRAKFAEYQNACGVTKNIKRLFSELPQRVGGVRTDYAG